MARDALIAGNALAHRGFGVCRERLIHLNGCVVAAGDALANLRARVCRQHSKSPDLALGDRGGRMLGSNLGRSAAGRRVVSQRLPLGGGVETNARHVSTVPALTVKSHFACVSDSPHGPGSHSRLLRVEPSSEQVSNRVFTLPNILSFMRLLLVPVFLVLIIRGEDAAALIVLVVSSASDYLDGVLARALGQITRLGQLLDPAADRLFIFAALVGLLIRGVIPWWLVAVIVSRDIFMVGVGLVLARHGYGPLPVHHLGKVATFFLLYALPTLMVGHAFPALAPVTAPLGWAFALWGAFIYWWAGFLYARQTFVITRAVGSTPESDTLKGTR